MALLSRIKEWLDGDVLEAVDLNAEFNNLITGLDPAYIEDESDDATAMQTMVDPYPGGSPSLATSLQGEIQRLRYMIAQIMGETYWYLDPDTNIASLHTKKLDDMAAPDDNTDLDASTSAHGLLVKATAPSSGYRNVVGIDNGETAYKMIALFDDTTPANLASSAATGSALTVARRDHVHAVPKLDDLASPDDNTDLNVSTSAHGLCPKAPNDATKFLDGTGAWDTLKPSDCIQYCTLWIPAGAWKPTKTAGCADLASTQTSSNKDMYEYLAFDGSTEEYADCNIVMPEEWDRGTIKAKVYWIPATGCSQGDTVEWELAAVAVSDDDDIDASLGTSQVISDTVLAGKEGDLHITGATPAITVGGSPALGDLIHLKLSRNVSGTDDMTEDAWLVGVLIQYGILTSQPSAW